MQHTYAMSYVSL